MLRILIVGGAFLTASLVAGFIINYWHNRRHEQRQAERQAEIEAARNDEVIAEWTPIEPEEEPAPDEEDDDMLIELGVLAKVTETAMFTPDFDSEVPPSLLRMSTLQGEPDRSAVDWLEEWESMDNATTIGSEKR